MSGQIPFARLGVSARLEESLGPDAPRKVRMAIARGLMPLPPDEQVAALYVLAGDPDSAVQQAAIASVRDLPDKQVMGAIGMRTHPKVLEFLVEFREQSNELDERIGMMRKANDRTVRAIARRAHPHLCEMLARNHERLLMTPDLFVDLHGNENCSDVVVQAAESFLRMQRSLPEVPPERPFRAASPAATPAAPAAAPLQEAPAAPVTADQVDLMAEIQAALRGERSPALVQAQEQGLDMFELDDTDAASSDPQLGGFVFDFSDDADDFSWDLTGELDRSSGEEATEVRISMERQIADLTVGKKIKLAYLGNVEVRKILIRDSNKIVAAAVVKSGRLTDNEVANFAGNKNLDNEVLREIAMNREFTRKYPVKVALVNNPKTPVSVAVGMVNQMQKKDLLALTRNRNIPSVVSAAAMRLYRQKHQKNG